MASFGRTSRARLDTAHHALQKLFYEVVKEFDCTIIEGHRSEEKQLEMYKQGRSKLKPPHSKHNSSPSMAVDVAPWPLVWPSKSKRPKTFAKDLGRFYMFVGYVRAKAEDMGIEIRCGADWDGDWEVNDQNFDDLPHFELVQG